MRDLLRQHGAALCRTDRRGTSEEPDWTDSGWTYVRLHEGDGAPHPWYRDKTLGVWAERLASAPRVTDAYVFFNNDHVACAVRDASRFARACTEHGLDVTRVPGPA